MSSFENPTESDRKRPGAQAKPVSIRLTEAEKRILLERAGRTPLATYVRDLALRGNMAAPRRRVVTPYMDHDALARVLAFLGRSDIAVSLGKLASASEIGALSVTPEIEREIHDACGEVRAMRRDLMAALGIQQNDGAP